MPGLTNGTTAPTTSNKSRGQLKRLKAKKKAALGPTQPAGDDRPLEVRPPRSLAHGSAADPPSSPHPASATRQAPIDPTEVKEENKDAEYVEKVADPDQQAFADIFARFQLPSVEVEVSSSRSSPARPALICDV